jgi:hypothetical protein
MLTAADDTSLDLMRASRQALEKIQESKGKQLDVLTEAQEIAKQKDMGRHMFKPYDSLVFESKLRVDMMYYDQLLQKLDDELHEGVETVLTSLFTNIRKIYEFVNIKPEIFGSGVTDEVLNESMEKAQRKLAKAIYDNLDRNFYKLNVEQRKEKYFEESKSLIKDLIQDGTDHDDAIALGVKVVVLENLLRNIAFPFGCWARINHLVESENYGKIFDQSALVNLVESFEKKIHSVAKIVAVCV